jgi:ABC-type lipoprotein release transport system permease subunit
MPQLPGVLSFVLVLVVVSLALGVLARLGRVPLLYNLRNLLVRWRTSLTTALAFTLVIALFLFMLAFVQGFMRMTAGSGHPANVMVLSRGATDELVSTISAQEAGADVALQPGVLRNDKGQPLCSREVYVVVNQLLSIGPNDKRKQRLVQVRGVEDSAIAAAVHGLHRLAEGEWFSPAGIRALPEEEGSRHPRYAVEAVIGHGFARQWRLGVGDVFDVGPRSWIVTGIMAEGGSTFDSEMWARDQQVGEAFGKEHAYTSLLLRTADARAAKALAEELNTGFKKAPFHAMPEPEYYATLASTSAGFVSAVYVLAVILAVGGVLGVMNTMFAAVTQRRKDIAMLRVIGFARWQVLVCFLIESLLLAVVGGSIGCAIGSCANGWSANSLIGNRNMAFTLNVDAQTLSIAVVFAVIMGALGGMLPALSTLRIRPLEVLRAG